MKQGQFPAVLPLASLDGQNGFKIDAETAGEFAGFVAGGGDINGDGLSDFIIGAPNCVYGITVCNAISHGYVVFGNSGLGQTGLLSVANLNGTNGFKLVAETPNDGLGCNAVSIYGDINNDGYADIFIGAYGYNGNTGRSYIIFGGPAVGKDGFIALTDINGSNGFKLDGEGTNDVSGLFINTAGDVNDDGYTDVLIGAPDRSDSSGRGYAIFGGKEIISNGGLIKLSTLNGSMGFKMDGEAGKEFIGRCLSSAGDVNGDGITDFIISGYGYNNYVGRSYVVFGDPGIGKSGLLSLSSLNGKNGFKLDGEAGNDYSGHSVNFISDINGDGIVDLFIGAFNRGSGTGRSYVVFGGPDVGRNGLLPLSSLNGTNGFKIDGESAGSQTSYWPAGTGDINSDGFSDLIIGAAGYNGNIGRSYALFGGPIVGSGGVISLSNLNGIDGFKLDGERGGDQSGWSVSIPGDMNGDGLDDLLIGAIGYNSNTGRSYVVFGDIPPVLMTNQMNISMGETVRMNATYLSAYDLNHNNDTLSFIPTGVSHGRFESLDNPGIPLANFTQQRIHNGEIQFVHDGTLMAPGYSVSVHTTGIAYVASTLAKITFTSLKLPPSVFPAVVPLSSLNGKTGFKIDGEAAGDYSGQWVNVGDMNGDGYADSLIGALGHNNNAGRSYVVFGGSGIGSSGLLKLSSLNGTNGFKLDGEDGNSGISLSAGGDINGDGYRDLVIGAYHFNNNVGRSYVVFGGPTVGKTSILPLSSLNGMNGFKLDGENGGDCSGYPVDSGDINGDGYADLLIGALGWNSYTGRSYVIFGKSGVGSNGLIALSSLNGVNGFKINGEAVNDCNGAMSVGSAGDVNGDGYIDLVIGTPGHNSSTGRVYVIFGKPGIGSSGSIALSSLNGTNGFKLDGEFPGDSCGWSTGGIGDINGDGFPDLAIGAAGYSKSTGRSYVIFGKTDVGSSGLILLSSLNGTNGFKIDGDVVGEESGHSVQAAGDINGDGYADLSIGAPGYNSGSGCIYIVFGNSEIGKNGLLSLSSLNGANGFKLNGENPGDTLGYAFSFTGDINSDGISDVLVGASLWNSHTGRSYVVFGDVPPQLNLNQLIVNQNQTVVLDSQNLNAADFNHPPAGLRFNVTQIQRGYFSLVNSTDQAITSFNQSQVWDGQIQFIHDGSQQAPSYAVQVQSDGLALPLSPQTADITFYRRPSFIYNQLQISEGATVLITANDLSLQDDYPDAQVLFTISDCQNGQFELIPARNDTTIQFTQQQIKLGQIQFVHNNKPVAPSYQVTGSDGYFTVGPASSVINFTLVDKPPTLLNPIPPETFAVGDAFNFKIAADTFYDEQGKPIRLSSTLADGLPLPEEITFDSPTSTFTGLMNLPEDYNISVTATSVAQLSTVTFFALKIAERTSPDSPLIDLKTVSSVLSSIGGVILGRLIYLYYRRLQRIERETDNPFAEEIHSKLGLSYVDFHDRGRGQRFSDIVNTMVKQLKSEKKVEIEDKNPDEYKRYAELFAKHMSSGKRIKTDHCGISFLGKSLNFREFNEEKSREIVEEIYQESQQPGDAKESRPNINCWGRLFCCRRSSAQNDAKDEAQIRRSSTSVSLNNVDSSVNANNSDPLTVTPAEKELKYNEIKQEPNQHATTLVGTADPLTTPLLSY